MQPTATSTPTTSTASRLTALGRGAVAVALIDLAVKAVVVGAVPAGESRGIILPVSNPEFTLGVAGTHPIAMVALMVLGLVLAVPVAVRLVSRGQLPPAAAGLVLGGSAGNTVDRALDGAVQDFLVIGDMVVNLGDLAVIAGLLIAATYAVRGRGPQRSRRGTIDLKTLGVKN